MFTEKTSREVEEGRKRWEKEVEKVKGQKGGKEKRFSTVSDLEIKAIYTPEDIKDLDFSQDIGYPGIFPFTRGCQPTMYRGREWTFRMFSGMGSAEDTNKRWHHLLKEGETGLSTAFDFPTLMGYDSDSHRARGECGKCGVAIDTLRDFEILTRGIPLDSVTTSMTVNPPASILWAMYLTVAQKAGIDWDGIGGTIQNDMLKEFIAQKTFMLPPEPSIRLISDTIEFGTRHVPLWNTISISGYHIREAGSTAVQELAFTLADGIAYVQDVIARKKLDVDSFAPRLSFFFNSHLDFFEEIAKFRAARRMWAHIMRDRFKAKNPRSWWMRFHTQTAGCSLTAQQPYNNIVRTTTQALAAVMGGTQSLHTNALDETLALPSEFAATIALRTQQILADETGVTNTIDPLAGANR
jgi:methylmalonyl-CoA mutase N-terminal domain/subunit